jgi:O-6-methylguanine DNA methyltransferase
MKTEQIELPVATAEGNFMACYSKNGLARLDFPKVNTPASNIPAAGISTQIRLWHRITETALKAVLAGRAPRKFPPLDVVGTAFQKSVWNALRKIPAGQTRSYGEVAQAIGRPRAVRAVGGACGANPIPVLVPCHRVLAANKKIGGFSSGLAWKRRLLAREGVKV